MDWSVYNNTTPWGLLTEDQRKRFKDEVTKRNPLIGLDGLDYSDWHYTDLNKFKVSWKAVCKFQRYYKVWEDYQWTTNVPGNSSVVRCQGPFTKAQPTPEPREFYIVLDHGKLIGYFNEYPVALQHYEIIKTREQF